MTIWSHRTSVMFAYQSMCCVIMCHYQDRANNLYCSLSRCMMVFLTHNEECKVGLGFREYMKLHSIQVCV